MRNHAAIILFLVTITLAAGAALIYNQHRIDGTPQPVQELGHTPEIIQVDVWGIDDREAQHMTITLRGGTTPVELNGMLISIETEHGSTDLPVR